MLCITSCGTSLTHYQINYYSVEITFSLYMNWTHIPSSVGFSAPQTTHKCSYSHLYTFMTQTTPIHQQACNSHSIQPATTRPDWEKGFPLGNGHRTGREDCFLNPFVHRRTAVAHPEPTKVFPKQSPETAMLSAPFRCTHPPPPIPPFLLKQNLSPKVIAGSDITRWKFHAGYIRLHPGKRLNLVYS